MAREDDITRLQRHLVNVLVVRTSYQRDVVDKLIKEGVTETKAEAWQNVLRHYWEEDQVVVRVAGKDLQYGYEYCGLPDMLVITECRAELMLHCCVNYSEGRGSAATGIVETARTQTIKDCAVLLGKPVFRVTVYGGS